MKYAKWLFLGPIIIHLWWAFCVVAAIPKTLDTTGIYDIHRLSGGSGEMTAFLLVAVSVLAFSSLLTHSRHKMLSLMLLAPQQAAMMISSVTAMRCMVTGRFADGAEYDSYFIAADQCYIFVIGIMHTCLMLDVYVWGNDD